MRSRYSAFAKRLPGYRLASWHPETRPAEVTLDPRQRWIGLRVLVTSEGDLDHEIGTVTFEAEFDAPGGRGTLREVSRFERVAGEWRYVDGQVRGTD